MRKRIGWKIILLILCIGIGTVAAMDHWVTSSTKKQLYSNIASIPAHKVGLLLGTSKFIRKGVINPYYQYRIDAAVDLYNAGKIAFILVSGDNTTNYYNEPESMKKDLVARGVPAEKIFMDYAGVHTLDSILRCRDIFGEDNITIISQPFHNERALFIANHKKINAVAYNAKGVAGYTQVKVEARERLSRIKMFIELLLNTPARYYYGQKIEIK